MRQLEYGGHFTMTQKGLSIVCIGGGTGLSSLLSGINQYIRSKREGYDIINMDKLAAIVTVSDDGGSSGRLIDEFGVLPPGDIRNCLVALSPQDEIMTKLFEYRFNGNGELGGHTVGNLLLTALTHLNDGSFPKAIEYASRVLNVQGRILPATLDGTILCAELANGEIVRSESHIPKRKNQEPIKRVFLEQRVNGKTSTENTGDFVCPAHDEAVEAIEEADAIIIGPGSLYTSIMPNLAVRDIGEALKKSDAMKIYVCNIMIEPGETDGYSVFDHVKALLRHVDFKLDCVVANNAIAPSDIILQYIREGLLEQFNRIKSHATEAINTLEGQTEYAFESLAALSGELAQLSQNAAQMVDASKVQVLFNSESEVLDDIRVVEEDLIYTAQITDKGVQKNVIRHEPYKLSHSLVKQLSKHPELGNG